MPNQIHPTASIGKNVVLGDNNEIGPNAVIASGVKIGSGNKIFHGVTICHGTEIGDLNTFHMHAVIGHEPQDLKFKNEPTFTRIGNKNTFREFTSIHRGTEPGTATVIGNENYFMAYCHIAHNCIVGSNIIMVNQSSLTGHCVVEDRAFISGMVGFHQFSHIGTLAMVSALSAFNKDIPPYVMCGGRPGVAQGLNVVGMRRAGFKPETRAEIKKAYKLLYRSGLSVSNAVEMIKKECSGPEVKHFVEFIENSKRGIIRGQERVCQLSSSINEDEDAEIL
ncbi:MAG TPA: acyl-[acyl-carrier-protein]--UDP-N-acetylglucosamine O-acyltransferase [Candidatus Omnitrophica bacterium]|nr:acyl-[acyl-carrier-protein]--UDP-N-acetylglucosamine O-acyltransferase [Candidatus Omnitrophota bacterium]